MTLSDAEKIKALMAIATQAAEKKDFLIGIAASDLILQINPIYYQAMTIRLISYYNLGHYKIAGKILKYIFENSDKQSLAETMRMIDKNNIPSALAQIELMKQILNRLKLVRIQNIILKILQH